MVEPIHLDFEAGSAGVAGSHPRPAALRVFVAPSLSPSSVPFNSIEPGLFTAACWRMDDLRFEFDSSFVLPAAKKEIGLLAAIVKEHPGHPLSVFGHADPAGEEAYNKTLSGRRAQAIYGLLIRDAALWEDLYSHPFGGDHWGKKQLEAMAACVPPLSASAASGSAGSRKALFLAYMDFLCDGESLLLTPEDFLARGEAGGGKGDYQGCSELNPVLIFSKEEQARLDKPAHHAERNARNAPNRRVLVFLFRKGTKVDEGSWPCPKVSEGVEGCKKRLWSDGPQRIVPSASERKYEDTKDTFACRFYDRLAMRSPCEGTGAMVLLRVRVCDHERHPIPDAPVRVVHGTRTWEVTADSHGFVLINAQKRPEALRIEWTRPEWAEESGYPFLRIVYTDLRDSDEGDRRRLFNLGYHKGTMEADVADYQVDFGHAPTGQLADIRAEMRAFHDGGARPGGGST